MTYRMPGDRRGPVAEGEGGIGFAAQKQYLSSYVVRNRRPEQFDQAVVRSVPDMTAATSGPIC